MVKNPHTNAADVRDAGSTPESGREEALEEGMATHSSILALRIPWTEAPGGLQSMGCKRVGHNLVTKQQQEMMNILSTWFSSCSPASHPCSGQEDNEGNRKQEGRCPYGRS